MSWTHIEDTKPKAQKDYRCYLCGRLIEKGTIHIKRFGIGDQGCCSYRMHANCEALTHDWDCEMWEYHDEYEFRKELEKAVKEATFIELGENINESREKISNTISDMVSDLLLHDRKGDDELPSGEIERLVESGLVPVDCIVKMFEIKLRGSIKPTKA